MRIPTCRFHFQVLAYHVESKFLGLFDIVAQGFVRRCGIQTVGPPALVERTEMEDVFVVQLQAHVPFLVSSCGEFPHGGVAFHFVLQFAVGIE